MADCLYRLRQQAKVAAAGIAVDACKRGVVNDFYAITTMWATDLHQLGVVWADRMRDSSLTGSIFAAKGVWANRTCVATVTL